MLKYSQGFYKGKITELETYASMLTEHIETLKNFKSQLPEFWDDENGLSTARALESAIVGTNHALTQIKMQLAQYGRLVDEYEGASQDVQQKIENALSALDSLASLAPAVAGAAL